MLPDEDGITILKKLRRDSRTEDLPVIMATAKGTEYDKVIGLDLGVLDMPVGNASVGQEILSLGLGGDDACFGDKSAGLSGAHLSTKR